MKRFRYITAAAGILLLMVAGVIALQSQMREAKIKAYLADSVIVGDSVAMGYQLYCGKSGDESLQAMRFLVAGSFAAHNSLDPVSEESVHPLYQGEQRPVWESISMLGARNVFLFLGLNDLGKGDDTCEKYQELVDNIKEWSPEVRIHVISVTYALKEGEKGEVNNENIRRLNRDLRELAIKNGWGFIDLATPLSDGEGNLRAEYCSDSYVHQTAKAYPVWTRVLHWYVGEQIGRRDGSMLVDDYNA